MSAVSFRILSYVFVPLFWGTNIAFVRTFFTEGARLSGSMSTDYKYHLTEAVERKPCSFFVLQTGKCTMMYHVSNQSDTICIETDIDKDVF